MIGADGFRLDGKVAIVTGSGRNIGRAIAESFAACGAKVVVDSPGEGGNGGAGSGSSFAIVGPGPSGPGPQTATATSVGPGGTTVTATSVVSSVVTGPMTCDSQGDCSFCAECAIATECADAWNNCQNFQPCANLLNCFNTCEDQQCYDKCIQAFPDGIDLGQACRRPPRRLGRCGRRQQREERRTDGGSNGHPDRRRPGLFGTAATAPIRRPNWFA